jgi:hypothetical protein
MGAVKLNYVIIADNAFFSQENNTLNIIGIFDKIAVENFPALHSKLSIVTSCTGPVGTYQQKLILKSSDGTGPAMELKGEIKILNEGQKAQLIANITAIPLLSKGEYRVNVEIDGELQEQYAYFTVDKK